MRHAKVREDRQLEVAPNPLKITVANPSDELYEQFGWLPVIETDPPEYDPETQYLVNHWEEIDGKAVQVWEVKEIEQETVETEETEE